MSTVMPAPGIARHLALTSLDNILYTVHGMYGVDMCESIL